MDSTHKELNWHVFGLLVECNEARDWSKCRALAKQAWFSLVQDKYSDLGEISPATRSYWAMRIGLCDAYLDSARVMRYSDVSTSAPPEIGAQAQEFIRELADQVAARIDNTQNEERAHLENLINSRLPPSNSELRDFIDERLGHVLSKYPSTAIRSALIRAERYYLTHTDIDDSKLWFSKSVEGIFQAAFVDGLMSFIKETEKPVEFIFASNRGAELLSKERIRRLSPGEWSDAFRALGSTAPVGVLAKGSILNQYLSSCFGNVDLNELASDLGQVQQYRNSAGHFHKDGRPDEVRNLDEFRKFVLGIKCKSVIEKITDMLRPSNASDLER